VAAVRQLPADCRRGTAWRAQRRAGKTSALHSCEERIGGSGSFEDRFWRRPSRRRVGDASSTVGPVHRRQADRDEIRQARSHRGSLLSSAWKNHWPSAPPSRISTIGNA